MKDVDECANIIPIPVVMPLPTTPVFATSQTSNYHDFQTLQKKKGKVSVLYGENGI